MQQSLLSATCFLLLSVTLVVCDLTTTSQLNETSAPAPIFLHSDPDLALKSPRHMKPGVRPHSSENSAATPTLIVNRTAGPAPTSAESEPKFKFIPTPDGGVNITVTVPTPVLSMADPPYSFFRLTSRDGSIKHCVPFSSSAPSAPDSAVSLRSALVAHLPLNKYCVQLGCSCELSRACPRRPTRCRFFDHRGGIDMRAWRRAASVSVWHHPDTAAGPAISVRVSQTGYRFESFNLSVVGCKADGVLQLVMAADEWLRLDTSCSLSYNSAMQMEVYPDTWFCGGGTGGCRVIPVNIGPLQPLPRDGPPLLRAAAPSGWLVASLTLLALSAVAVAAAGLLWSRRRQRRQIAVLASTAGCHSFAAIRQGGGAGRPSVLLLHLARSDAEREVVRGLTAALRARGAAVTDCAAPESRQALRRDAAALLSEVPADGRVLVLASPAVSAALAAAGGAEHERLVAAAVRQLSASRLTADYGRVYQVRLSADAPTLPGLVTGAVYTLPEYQHELVTALLGAGAASDHTLITETHKGNGLAEHSV